MQDKTEWRVVPSFPMFEVNRSGDVRHATTKRPRALRPNAGGYSSFNLIVLAHRLVCEAFNGPPSHVTQWIVNHKNGNKTDNRANNLEWTTRTGNLLHATHILGKRGGQFGPNRVRRPAGAQCGQ